MPDSILVFRKTARIFQRTISLEPVELFQRIKKQIKARLMPYWMPSVFMTMQAMGMVQMAFKNGFPRWKCSLVHILDSISIKFPSTQSNSSILLRINMYWKELCSTSSSFQVEATDSIHFWHEVALNTDIWSSILYWQNDLLQSSNTIQFWRVE